MYHSLFIQSPTKGHHGCLNYLFFSEVTKYVYKYKFTPAIANDDLHLNCGMSWNTI